MVADENPNSCGMTVSGRLLRSSAHFGPPPTHAHQQKTPVLEELRWFVLKGVANELQKPAKDEESGGKHPEPMIENGGHSKRQGRHDQWNAKAMAEPVDWMRMAARILRNPLFAGAST
jgi:hypothetical protein